MNSLTFLGLLETSPRKRIELAALRQYWLTAHPEQLQHPERDALLLAALIALDRSGRLRLPAARSFAKLGNPPMPGFITMSGTSKNQPAADWGELFWLPELSFWTELSACELVSAKAINEWLVLRQQRRRNGAHLMAVPLRERALEIFGDEKFLDNRVRDKALFGGRLPLELIEAFLVPHPLPYRRTSAPGRPVLVVENHHTFWSLSQWNSVAQRYAAVVYGAGNAFHHCGLALQEAIHECQAEGALYFGDLDPAGIAIPLRFNQANQIKVVAALDLYRFVLKNGVRRSPVLRRAGDEKAVDTWLPMLSGAICSMWQANQWIPQESLGTEQLVNI